MSNESQTDRYYIKNWWQFQHYKHRNPPWIKLHKSILHDAAIQSLSPGDRYRLIELWLAASDQAGTFPARVAYVWHTLGLGNHFLASTLLAELEVNGLISKQDIRGRGRDGGQESASKMLAQSTEYSADSDEGGQ